MPRSKIHRPIFPAVIAALLIARCVSIARPVPVSRAQAATLAYRRAVRRRITLESRPEHLRSEAEYTRAIQAFRAVYAADPASVRAPEALADAAALYEEMGRRFSTDRYYLKSIQAFRFLIAQYPGDLISRDALFTIAEIYRTDLEDPEDARATFNQFIREYPRSPRVPEARVKLARIERGLAAWEKKNSSSSSVAATRAADVGSDRAPQSPAGVIREVTGIRDWVGPNYTRVVIGVEGPVTFTSAQLHDPDRIYFDLQNTRLSPALAGKSFPVEDRFLEQIRIAQFEPNVVRVVLDVQRFHDYTVFSLPSPFRLVIDIHGQPPALLAQRKPASPPTARSSSVPAQVRAAPRSAAPLNAAASGAAPNRRVAESARPAAPPRPTPESLPITAQIKPAAPLLNGERTLTRALGLKVERIVIDPGHGGYDTGAIGPGGLEEKNVVLDVALRLRKLLEERTDAQVFMTRSTDTFIPLEERTAIANADDADLFISIHANASRDPEARGIETYYLNFTSDPEALAVAARENATSEASVHQLQSMIKKIALNEKIQESRQFADAVQRAMVVDLSHDGDSEPNRGVRKAPFVVLIGANMPSILAEISFITNPHDNHDLRRPAFREEIAKALCAGIIRYMNELGGVKLAQQTRPLPPN